MSSESALAHRFDRFFVALGLAPRKVQLGTSYFHDRRKIVRVDPKPRGDFLRIHVGEAAEQAAPRELVGTYRQRGWLRIDASSAEIAESYLEGFVAKELAKRR